MMRALIRGAEAPRFQGDVRYSRLDGAAQDVRVFRRNIGSSRFGLYPNVMIAKYEKQGTLGLVSAKLPGNTRFVGSALFRYAELMLGSVSQFGDWGLRVDEDTQQI